MAASEKFLEIFAYRALPGTSRNEESADMFRLKIEHKVYTIDGEERIAETVYIVSNRVSYLDAVPVGYSCRYVRQRIKKWEEIGRFKKIKDNVLMQFSGKYQEYFYPMKTEESDEIYDFNNYDEVIEKKTDWVANRFGLCYQESVLK